MREDWIECEAELLGELIRGINYKKPQSSDSKKEGYLPILRANNIKANNLNFDDLKFVDQDLVKSEQKILRGDIVFAMSSGSKHLVGKSGQAQSDYQGSFGAFCSVFRPNENIDPNFIQFYFHSGAFRRIISNASKGSNINNLKREHVLNAIIPLPSTPEQRAIVAKIEELFSDLDKGIADLKKAQDQLKVYRQAVLKKAFEGELTKEWRDNTEFDTEWTTYSFAEITESLKRGPFGGDLKKAFFVESGYAVYEQQHAINNDFTSIRYFIDQERYDKLKACNVGPGDYIVSCSGTMGKIARVPKESPSGVINQALLRIRINDKIISHEYFLEFFKSSMFQRKILKDSRGSGMQNMAGIKEIKPIQINVPPLSEQHQIVQEIESRLSVCDKVEESITESLEKAKALRQSILKKAFEGTLLSEEEIAACKAAPDYEPASVLLEKIKAEKKKK